MAQINKPSEHFNPKLYSGTGAENAITGVGFQPDWTWIKNRSITANHHLFDVIRGATKYIITNSTNAEATDAQQLKSFDSDGFTVGTNGNVNGSGNNIVSWNWKAGGTASSNSDGTITSSVSANTTAGFSIVSYTGNGTGGATVGHGLGTTPHVIIIKNRTDSSSSAWSMYHHKAFVSASNPNILYLNSNVGEQDDTNVHHTTTTFNSTVFSLGTYNGSNGNGDSMIAYCFNEVKGYSKFGKYTGNGNSDGTFVYTGFKPAWVMFKRAVGGTANWIIFDNKRDTFNESGDTSQRIEANLSNAETQGNSVDFFSNGFKMKNSGAGNNASGSTYIYMAFAEQPLVGTNNIPATAR